MLQQTMDKLWEFSLTMRVSGIRQGSKCFHLLRFLWPNQELKKLSVEGESLIPRFTLSSSMVFFFVVVVVKFEG